MNKIEVPLFPLHTVLYPGGPLPLRVFEARYLDMISHCLKSETNFGVVLIREGKETGPVTMHEVGTLARITDWYQGSDGLLGVTAIGENIMDAKLKAYRAVKCIRWDGAWCRKDISDKARISLD